jgi:hypothetical protein
MSDEQSASDEYDDDGDDPLTYSFKTLYNPHGIDHIKPLWISNTASPQVHQLSVEIDTGAACNVIPENLYTQIFGKKKPQQSKARIQAYGSTPVPAIGKCTLRIHHGNGLTTPAAFQITRQCGNPIIGRITSKNIGYVAFPGIGCPPMTTEPITHVIESLQQHENPFQPDADPVQYAPRPSPTPSTQQKEAGV